MLGEPETNSPSPNATSYHKPRFWVFVLSTLVVAVLVGYQFRLSDGARKARIKRIGTFGRFGDLLTATWAATTDVGVDNGPNFHSPVLQFLSASVALQPPSLVCYRPVYQTQESDSYFKGRTEGALGSYLSPSKACRSELSQIAFTHL